MMGILMDTSRIHWIRRIRISNTSVEVSRRLQEIPPAHCRQQAANSDYKTKKEPTKSQITFIILIRLDSDEC